MRAGYLTSGDRRCERHCNPVRSAQIAHGGNACPELLAHVRLSLQNPLYAVCNLKGAHRVGPTVHQQVNVRVDQAGGYKPRQRFVTLFGRCLGKGGDTSVLDLQAARFTFAGLWEYKGAMIDSSMGCGVSQDTSKK